MCVNFPQACQEGVWISSDLFHSAFQVQLAKGSWRACVAFGHFMFFRFGFFSSLFARYNFYSYAMLCHRTALVLSSKMASSANIGPWYEPARQRGYLNFGVCFGFPIGFPRVFPWCSASAVARPGRRPRQSWPAPRRYSRRGSGKCWGPGTVWGSWRSKNGGFHQQNMKNRGFHQEKWWLNGLTNRK